MSTTGIIETRVLGHNALAYKLNMWSFLGYSVGLAILDEQNINLKLIEQINRAAQNFDILLVGAKGSTAFAIGMASLHVVQGVFETNLHLNWAETVKDCILVKGELFKSVELPNLRAIEIQ